MSCFRFPRDNDYCMAVLMAVRAQWRVFGPLAVTLPVGVRFSHGAICSPDTQQFQSLNSCPRFDVQ